MRRAGWWGYHTIPLGKVHSSTSSGEGAQLNYHWEGAQLYHQWVVAQLYQQWVDAQLYHHGSGEGAAHDFSACRIPSAPQTSTTQSDLLG